ncbi:MAG: CapA family protein [Chloroflexi bacterium]|nr:CapA family protein [Chloroflexota bacterium]
MAPDRGGSRRAGAFLLAALAGAAVALGGCVAEGDPEPTADPSPTVAPATLTPTAAPATPTVAATQTPTATASPSPAPTPPPTPSPPPARVVLAAVGDVMLGRSVGVRLEAEGAGVAFASVRDILAGADIAVANLESAIGVTGAPAPKAYTFRAPPIAVEALALAGIDLVSLANNHSLDFGPESLAETRALLAEAGILSPGAGPNRAAAHAPATIEREGLTIAFLAYVTVPVERGGYDPSTWAARGDTPGVAWLDIPKMAEEIAAARRDADLVVVLLHFGMEWEPEPSAAQREQARAAIDAGATLVIGSHPHVLQPLEAYGGGLIAYSLGNFVFDGFWDPANDSAILLVELTAAGVAGYELVPVTIVDGIPTLAAATESGP